MTTYTIQGFRVQAGEAGEDFQVIPASLEVFTSPADGQLHFYYLSPGANRTTVRLSDYNMTLDKTHMNDLSAEVSIDVSGLTWRADGTTKSSNLLAMHYEEEGIDFYFGFGPDPLPPIETANDLRAFFVDVQSSKLDIDGKGGKFQLSNVPDVEISGVYIPNLEAPLTVAIVAEAFEFNFENAPDPVDPDNEPLFEIAASADDDAPQSDEFEFIDVPADDTFVPDHIDDGF